MEPCFFSAVQVLIKTYIETGKLEMEVSDPFGTASELTQLKMALVATARLLQFVQFASPSICLDYFRREIRNASSTPTFHRLQCNNRIDPQSAIAGGLGFFQFPEGFSVEVWRLIFEEMLNFSTCGTVRIKVLNFGFVRRNIPELYDFKCLNWIFLF